MRGEQPADEHSPVSLRSRGAMRVLFLNPIGAVGGAERVLLTAVAGVRRADPGGVVRVIAPADGPLLAAARAAGAEVDVAPMPLALGGLGDSRLRGEGWWGRLELVAAA